MPLSIINASGVNKTYREGSLIVDAAKEVDLVLPIGALAVIMGPSGGGKSTLLHLLGGLDRPDSGTLEVAGVCLDKASEKELNQFRRQKVGFIFQFYNLLPSFNALDNVCLPLLARGERQKNARNLAKDALEKVGLASRMKHLPGQLSGGEQQRAAIARALVVNPKLVLADEPTGNLDSTAAKEVVDLFVDLNRSMGISFVIATHNSEIQSIASHGFEMRDGYLKQI
jgi:lipoprotein-releasing system ATP-binding protein